MKTFNLLKLKNEFKEKTESLDTYKFVLSIDKKYVFLPQNKLKIYLTTSLLKTKILCVEILEAAENNKFFPSIALLRMLFEELILLTYVLKKTKTAKDWKSFDYFLTKVSIARRSGIDKPDNQQMPVNIKTALDEAEIFIKKERKDLVGIFEKTYTFISDYVHPNSPSRYYFFHHDDERVYFIYRSKAEEQDLGMILNYSCMTIELYKLFWERLTDLSNKKTL